MARSEAIKAAQETRLSGFRHHSYETEQQMLITIFQTGEFDMDALAGLGLNFDRYADVLGPTRIRSIRNTLICTVTIISRTAINYGLDAEMSFSLSDFYINEIEKRDTKAQLLALLREMLEHYVGLVKQERHRLYSLPVSRALRYIHQHIYERVRVTEAAARAKLNPRYFSALFKSETGQEPSQYIKARKMEEARTLLGQHEYSVAGVADALGYCSAAHFSTEFKSVFGKSPKQFLRAQGV
jgi:AraC-like DNA-binding protein